MNHALRNYYEDELLMMVMDDVEAVEFIEDINAPGIGEGGGQVAALRAGMLAQGVLGNEDDFIEIHVEQLDNHAYLDLHASEDEDDQQNDVDNVYRE